MWLNNEEPDLLCHEVHSAIHCRTGNTELYYCFSALLFYNAMLYLLQNYVLCIFETFKAHCSSVSELTRISGKN
jgi:hypothetical protein